MIERCVKEYANIKKEGILKNELMNDKHKIEAIGRINKAIKMRDKGYITIDEAIFEILNCIE